MFLVHQVSLGKKKEKKEKDCVSISISWYSQMSSADKVELTVLEDKTEQIL